MTSEVEVTKIKEIVMAKKFSELREKMSPEAKARAEEIAANLRAEYPLHELRKARGLSQEVIAKTLHVSSGAAFGNRLRS